MSLDFADWLVAQRPTLTIRWSDLLGSRAHPSHPVAVADEAAIATLNGTLTVDRLFDGLVQAAGENWEPLRHYLHSLGQTDEGQEPDLRTTIGTMFDLRRATRDQICATTPDPARLIAQLDQLDLLFEQIVTMLAQSWSDRAAALISEREFIAASLDSASAAADQRALQLKALNDISQRLSASLEADQLIDLVVTSLQRLTGVAHIAVWMARVVDQAPILEAVLTRGDEHRPLQGLTIGETTASDLIWRTFHTGQIQFDPNPNRNDQDGWLQPACGVLAFPIIINEQTIGVVSLQDPNPIEQLRFQQDLAQGVISQGAIALQNAQLYAEVRTLNAELEQRVAERTHELQEEKERLETIYAISTEVGQTLDLDQLLNTSLEMLVRITQADHASIMLVEEGDSNLLVTRAVYGVPASASGYIRFPIGTGIAGWSAQQRKPVLVNDVEKDERWISVPGGSLRKREGAMISVPLIVQGEVLGVLTLSHRLAGFFYEAHLRLLSACAGAIAIGVNNANLFHMISQEAERRYELLDHQQKEASQIAAILQSLSDGVIVCDLYGSVLTANLAAANILQRGVEDLLLWNLHDILMRYLGPRSRELPLDEMLNRPLSHANQPRIFSMTVKIGIRMISLTMGPVLKDDSEMLGALLVLHDITREVEADRLKTEFIGTMSHELRTPMTAIKGFTQLLAMGGLGPLNETQREFVNTIYANTERMIGLINDVLDITKIESGSVDLEWRSLHLAEALSGVVAELQGAINDRKHELSISIPPGLPLVRADAHRLHQILFNLLSNAAKYTPRGGKIWIEAQEANPAILPAEVRDGMIADRRYVQLNVRDTGVGISAEDLPRVFDRFYRTENPLKIEAGGTGLGLSLVKPLVDLLGGRIWVESTLGEGSCFSLILPSA